MLVVIFLVADGGGIAGGQLSMLIARGWSVNASRKVTLLICALCVVPVSLLALVSNL
jgi:ACS family hexuronate transporter-like MFS transporter